MSHRYAPIATTRTPIGEIVTVWIDTLSPGYNTYAYFYNDDHNYLWSHKYRQYGAIALTEEMALLDHARTVEEADRVFGSGTGVLTLCPALQAIADMMGQDVSTVA